MNVDTRLELYALILPVEGLVMTKIECIGRSSAMASWLIEQPHVLLADRYREHWGGIVTDVQTNLQWMRFSFGQKWEMFSCIGNPTDCTWKTALDMAHLLNRQGGYSGRHDWRLPTIEELQTLYRSNQSGTWFYPEGICHGYYMRPPSSYQLAFPNTSRKGWYWSSTTYEEDLNYVWVIYCYYGQAKVFACRKILGYGYVRLVRGQL